MIELEGAEEAQRAILGLYDEREIQEITDAVLHRLRTVAMDNTPVDTGAMRNAWVVTDAMLHISRSAMNPRTGHPVTDYASEIAEREGIVGTLVDDFGPFLEEEAQRYGYKP